MSQDIIYDFATRALMTLVMVSAPVILPVLITGVILGMFQAATSVNETVITFVPKTVVVIVCLLFFGHYMAAALMAYTADIFSLIPLLAR